MEKWKETEIFNPFFPALGRVHFPTAICKIVTKKKKKKESPWSKNSIKYSRKINAGLVWVKLSASIGLKSYVMVLISYFLVFMNSNTLGFSVQYLGYLCVCKYAKNDFVVKNIIWLILLCCIKCHCVHLNISKTSKKKCFESRFTEYDWDSNSDILLNLIHYYTFLYALNFFQLLSDSSRLHNVVNFL